MAELSASARREDSNRARWVRSRDEQRRIELDAAQQVGVAERQEDLAARGLVRAELLPLLEQLGELAGTDHEARTKAAAAEDQRRAGSGFCLGNSHTER